jgi:hypothetical protein
MSETNGVRGRSRTVEEFYELTQYTAPHETREREREFERAPSPPPRRDVVLDETTNIVESAMRILWRTLSGLWRPRSVKEPSSS